MADNPRAPTRKELAQFFSDPRTLRAFEQLFEAVPGDIDSLQEQIDALFIESGNANARSISVMGLLLALRSIVDTLVLAPAPFVTPPLDGLTDVYAPTPTAHDLMEWDDTLKRYVLTSVPYVDGIVVDKSSATAIKIDKASPDFGWDDMLGEITARGTGSTNPNWRNYRNGIYAYEFSVNDEVWINFHILHDYALGTDMYIHAHWSHNSAAVTTGAVTWAFEITYAKGHDQAAFTATKTVTVTQNANTTQYQHMIAEVQMSTSGGSATEIDTDLLEVDGLIMVRCYLVSNTMDGGALPFLHMIDIHYQSTGLNTKNKAPNFYS